MPPIQIHTASPINASKADGVTPETAPPQNEANKAHPQLPPTTTFAAPQYPAAQPGARPSLPAPTGVPAPYAAQPTATQKDFGPPAPQPGAFPVPPGSGSSLPPPPKVGEKYRPPQQTAAPLLPNIPYPAQMGIPPPSALYSAQQGASTTTFMSDQPSGSRPAYLGDSMSEGLSHPPGYQQNTNYQGPQYGDHSASGASHSRMEDGDGSEPGFWDSAKKWVSTAGESLAAAETEVWRRINKE